MLRSCQKTLLLLYESSKVMWERIARRTLLTLSLCLATFLGYLLFKNADSAPTSQPAPSGSIERADAKISEFIFTQSKGDAVEWQVQAKQARLFDRDKRAVLSGVDITFYGEQGKELTLSGDEGMFDIATKNLMLSNQGHPLVVETRSGYTIYTNHLGWKDETKELHTDDPVRIVGHGLEVTGRGMLGRMGSEEFEILEDVHVDLIPAS
jgi:LPS export ABC transporter protein LptC